MTIQHLIPATGWRALFARRLDTGARHLWTEPLIAWARQVGKRLAVPTAVAKEF